MCFASNRQTPIVNANRLSSNLYLTNRNYDRGHVRRLASVPRISLRSATFPSFSLFLSIRELRFMKATGYERSSWKVNAKFEGTAYLRLDWLVEASDAPITSRTTHPYLPFFASLPFCVHPSHRRQESRVKLNRVESRKGGKDPERSLGRKKIWSGEEGCASIFASEGTVAAVCVHLPLRI